MIKVFTMLMGEYEYVLNFVNVEEPSWIAKLIFVLFLLDMSIVLMNLVLGLAVSDIEQLQKNSAVRRMVQETYTVIFIDGVLHMLQKIPGVNKLTAKGIMNERTCHFKEVYYIDVVDLEPNSSNRLGFESLNNGIKYYPCPHNIVSNVAK